MNKTISTDFSIYRSSPFVVDISRLSYQGVYFPQFAEKIQKMNFESNEDYVLESRNGVKAEGMR